MRIRQLAAIAIVAAMPSVLTTTLLAQESDIVQHRQGKMKTMGRDMGAIKKLLAGGSGDLAQIGPHVAEIGKIGGEIPSLFPADADNTGSDALPAVWSDRAGFEKAAAHMTELADQLGETAKGGDVKATTAAFAALGRQGCGGCHSNYRKPEG